MIKNLPERKKLIKQGKEVSIKDLNLNDVDDRIMLNEVYENTLQYEHAKKFLDACNIKNNKKNMNKLIENIRRERGQEAVLKLRDQLMGEMTRINV